MLDAELTVPRKSCSPFPNSQSYQCSLKACPCQLRNRPCVCFPSLTPAFRRSCTGPAKIPITHPWEWGLGPNSCRQGMAQPDTGLGASSHSQHTYGLDQIAAGRVEKGRTRVQGDLFKGGAGALCSLEQRGQHRWQQGKHGHRAEPSTLSESARGR